MPNKYVEWQEAQGKHCTGEERSKKGAGKENTLSLRYNEKSY